MIKANGAVEKGINPVFLLFSRWYQGFIGDFVEYVPYQDEICFASITAYLPQRNPEELRPIKNREGHDHA